MKEGNQALQDVDRLPGRSKLKQQAKLGLITYLTNNVDRDRVDYPRYRRLGSLIGSREVEADCKTLVQVRCKHSGMRWSKTGAEQVLRGRCALRDNSFDDTWDDPGEPMATWHQYHYRQHQMRAA